MSTIPENTTVLIAGGGPGGSYAASALAREGLDVVLLEADFHPRYHVGESMLASLRHFLRFIDLDETFDSYGFNVKRGASFKLNEKREGFTDFIAAGGPNNYSWNVLRSEADKLFFDHAGKCGAKTFQGIKVNSLDFEPLEGTAITTKADLAYSGRPVTAHWSSKDGSSGSINFDYLIDATGRAGIVSTQYLKNRKFNQGLKNVASWGYWKGAKSYGIGTQQEGQPFFEALQDASGWCWFIPLHNGTHSIGIVQNQGMATEKKKAMGSPSGIDFYRESLKLVPKIGADLLADAELVSDIKSASDWSYNASTYATPHIRIVGDAGCFIDPYFSSGVHLALASALSASITIKAAIKGELSEVEAGKWHSDKVKEGYTRFLLVVLSAVKQIRKQYEPVLSDWDEDGFDKAFAMFRPIIQGNADVNKQLTQAELSKTLDFCVSAFEFTDLKKQELVMKKLEAANAGDGARGEIDPEGLSPEEVEILKTIRARQMLRRQDVINIENFGTDFINGFAPRMERGNLGLDKAATERPKPAVVDVYARGRDAMREKQELAVQELPN